MVEQCCTAALERLERAGRSVRGALLPTPQAHAEPLACEGTYGSLVGFPLRTLLLVIALCPAGMAD
jgi:hypothetical protein